MTHLILAQTMPVDPSSWAKYGGILGLIILAFFVLVGWLVRWLLDHVTKITCVRDQDVREFAKVARDCNDATIEACREMSTIHQDSVRELAGEVRTLNRHLLQRIDQDRHHVSE